MEKWSSCLLAKYLMNLITTTDSLKWKFKRGLSCKSFSPIFACVILRCHRFGSVHHCHMTLVLHSGIGVPVADCLSWTGSSHFHLQIQQLHISNIKFNYRNKKKFSIIRLTLWQSVHFDQSFFRLFCYFRLFNKQKYPANQILTLNNLSNHLSSLS